MKKLITALAFVISAVAIAASVGAAPNKPRQADTAIEQCIADQLRGAAFKGDEIAVRVSGGEAHLTGKVKAAGHKGRATQVARRCGATKVTNDCDASSKDPAFKAGSKI